MGLDTVLAIAATAVFGTISLLTDAEFIRALNTVANIVSITFLLKIQRQIRKEATPRLERIEQKVDDIIDH